VAISVWRNAPNRAGAKHRGDTLGDGEEVDAGESSDFLERLALEALDLVLGDRKDSGVDGISG
jgi:hypothetical protein